MTDVPDEGSASGEDHMAKGPLHTTICDILGIRHPVVLAGMAGGYTTPELVAAVSRAGGLGVFGATGMTADALSAAVRAARALTDAPVGVNVLLARPADGNPDAEAIQNQLAPFRADLDIPHPPPPPAAPPSAVVDLVEAGLEAGASVVSVGLGDPAPVMDLARRAGALVIAMVATVDDARRSVESGANILVAQGGEAGGHRSNFTVGQNGEVPLVGTMALVPQVVRAVTVPVIASGGIMDGRGLVAALALGAAGVQLGTVFLSTKESSASETYRAAMANAGDTETLVTAAVTGRPARMLKTDFVEAMMEGPAPLGWPKMAPATADVRAAADRQGRKDLAVYLTGQASALAPKEELSAEDLMRRITEEAREIIKALGAMGA
jgi:nitronate monooxygenase